MVDVMKIENETALNVFNEDTKILAAKYLEERSTNTVRKTLLECWIAIHTGLDTRTLVGQGGNFLALICTHDPSVRR